MKLFKEVPENDGVHYESLSPAQLAEENLKAWAMLEELKNWMASELSSNRVTWPAWEDFYRGIRATQKALKRLESQAPSSDLVREIREDREKARNGEELENKLDWDKLYKHAQKMISDFERIKKDMDELLAQSKTPPTAEEGKKDGRNSM